MIRITDIYRQEHVEFARVAPLAGPPASAGFPSPADDYLDGELDVAQYLVRNPSATYFMRAAGRSMDGAGISDGDLLVVDRSLEARDGHIVIAALDGEFTVKRLRQSGGRAWLQAENKDYPPLELNETSDFRVWGVVTHIIHSLPR